MVGALSVVGARSLILVLEVHPKCGRSLAEVQWTEDLANITGFSLSPSEIQQKSSGSLAEVQQSQNSAQSNHFLLLSGLSGLSLDFAWTSSGIQSCPTDFRWTVHWVHRKWQGPTKVRQSLLDKQWECKVMKFSFNKMLLNWKKFGQRARWILVTAISADQLFYFDHATFFSSHLNESCYYSNDSEAKSGLSANWHDITADQFHQYV